MIATRLPASIACPSTPNSRTCRSKRPAPPEAMRCGRGRKTFRFAPITINRLRVNRSPSGNQISPATALGAKNSEPNGMPSTRSEEHTYEIQSLMTISYNIHSLKKPPLYRHKQDNIRYTKLQPEHNRNY